jgi:phosphatidylserine/phosphatidylglycerophosphate/cardiolipin synthase-like enzyme/DNA/RNA endonuclease YhcR with UshA esterase domain
MPPLRRLLFPLLLLLTLAACKSDATPTPDRQQPVSGGTQQLLVLPDDGVQPVLDLIDSADDSIRFKIYLLTYRDIKAALVQAANRGVDVRVIIEQNPVGGSDSNQESYDQLVEGGAAVRWAPSEYRLTHEKTLVVDDRIALTGTFNYTHSSFTGNREYGLLIDQPALVSDIAAVFDADWAGVQPELSAGSPIILSPTTSRGAIQSLIDSAKETLWLEQASLLDDEVTDRLVAAVRRGVDVRFIGLLRQGEDDYAHANHERLRAAGGQVALLNDPLVHAKVIVADERQALIGSINLTYSSMELNREMGVLTEDAGVLQRLLQTLQADWQSAGQMVAAPDGVITWQEAGNYAGVEVTVAGDVVRTYDSGKVTFLNFSDDYRNTLTIAIFPSIYDRFPALPAEYFLNQQVEVTGLVKIYEGAPEIIVESPDQIRIVGAASAGAATVEPTQEPGTSRAVELIPEIVSWQDAGQYVGEDITIEGAVVRTYDSGKVTFLNFSDDWADTLSVVIFASDYGRFSTPPESLYLDQVVRVTGRVKEFKGRAAEVVGSPGPPETC